ncbi:HEPN domain-containing protein [Photobacterium sanguinicancri]|uniref:HEPN domain-containing protein n=1 Tax=Photobacterium sanguinicancri TaxID=875932 RepID=UPI0026E467AA|nr:HEPN domain-containing protein [Photobacterium sanguinicancri]MDO6501167.1 HEPN domain-containing protein [Photobacterium sanguinicancri]
MKKFKFISTLRYLKISSSLNGWLELMPGIDITNDKAEIKKVITDEFKTIAGVIEYDHFLNAENILYCELNESFFGKSLDSGQALFIWLHWLQMLLNDLWFIKDNAVVCEAAFCKLDNGSDSAWTRNNITNAAYTSQGATFVTIELSSQELCSWNKKSEQIQNYLHDANSTFIDSFTNTKFSRIGRCMRFIRAAIKEQHPAVKLSHYCSGFESLFSTDNTGLSHKLSERVALFLRDYDYDPIETFDILKAFYDIRSSVTHGSSLRANKEKRLSELSQQCDNYLRVILGILLDEPELRDLFDGKSDRFENYFKHKLLVAK